MKKVVITILGEDRPGIVHRVSKVLSDMGCNVLEASQTILQNEFAGIFIASMPEDLSKDRLHQGFEELLSPIGISAWIKDFKSKEISDPVDSEPYVITLRGPDRIGIIPGIAGVLSGFGVNIENLRAIGRQDDESEVIIVFEVAVPREVHRPAMREALGWKAEDLQMDLSVQHRDIFEAIHRI